MSTFGDGQVALFFNCQTLLVERFRQRFGDALQYSKNRAVVIDPTETIPIAEIRQCILMALTYHEAKKNHSVYA